VFLQLLHEENIPYNLLMTTERTTILPRRHQHEVSPGICSGVAFLEAHGELLIVGDTTGRAEHAFEQITEQDVVTELQRIALPPQRFDALLEEYRVRLELPPPQLFQRALQRAQQLRDDGQTEAARRAAQALTVHFLDPNELAAISALARRIGA
jgi:hypothetical protein